MLQQNNEDIKMKPRINHQMRKQLRQQKKLEKMVEYWTLDTTEIRVALVGYTRKYGEDMFIRRLSGDYYNKLRRMGE